MRSCSNCETIGSKSYLKTSFSSVMDDFGKNKLVKDCVNSIFLNRSVWLQINKSSFNDICISDFRCMEPNAGFPM